MVKDIVSRYRGDMVYRDFAKMINAGLPKKLHYSYFAFYSWETELALPDPGRVYLRMNKATNETTKQFFTDLYSAMVQVN